MTPQTSSTRPMSTHSSTSGNGCHGARGRSGRAAAGARAPLRPSRGTARAGDGSEPRCFLLLLPTTRLRPRLATPAAVLAHPRSRSDPLWASAGELHVPPAREHADQTQPGPDLPVAAARLAQL